MLKGANNTLKNTQKGTSNAAAFEKSTKIAKKVIEKSTKITRKTIEKSTVIKIGRVAKGGVRSYNVIYEGGKYERIYRFRKRKGRLRLRRQV